MTPQPSDPSGPNSGAGRPAGSRIVWIGALSAVVLAALWIGRCLEGPAEDAAVAGHAPPAEPAPVADPPAVDQPPPVLEPRVGEALRVELGPGETRSWILDVPPGHFLHLQAEQDGVDVVLALVDGLGREILVADRPIDDQGVEDLYYLGTDPSGELRLQLRATVGDRSEVPGPAPAAVNLRIRTLRPATGDDRSRARAAATFHRAKEAHRRGDRQAALELHEEALAAWRKVGDPARRGEVHDSFGRLCAELLRWREAEAHHLAAAEEFGRVGDIRWQGASLQNVGRVRYRLGEPDAAIEALFEALALRRQANDRLGEAITLYTLATIYQLRDETQHALDTYRNALALIDEGQAPETRAFCVHNLGVLYGDQGDWRRARDHLELAVDTWRDLGDVRWLANALNQLGEVALDRRAATEDEEPSGAADLQASAAAFDEALALRRQAGDVRGEASTLANLARIRHLQGEADRARRLYDQALGLLADLGWPLSEAKVLRGLGELALEDTRFDDAERSFRQAAELCRRVDDATGEAEGLSGLSRAHHGRGRLREALAASGRGLVLLEDVRPRTLAPSLRASFFATVQRHYDRHLDLLLELHELEPAAGWAAEALVVSERARARSLLDVLEHPGNGDGAKLSRSTADEAELVRQIAVLDRRRQSVRGRESVEGVGSKKSAELQDLERKLAARLDQLEALRAPRWAQGPTSRHASSGEVASLEDILQAVDRSGAELLVYRLGRDRSLRWTVSRSGIRVRRLPPRQEIERRALRAHGLLSRSHRRETLPALAHSLCELSRTLLGPDLAQPYRAPLVVVPDGALNYLPMAILPLAANHEDRTCRGGEPLLARRVVVTVPSASVWSRMASDETPEGGHPGSLAVVADPVFSADDPRLESKGAGTHDGDAPVGSGLRRLRSSRLEAQSVATQTPGRSTLLLDFDADKEMILDGALEGYRYLHFATHGVLEVEQPELSGLVLSQVDRQGRARDGVLRSLDLFRLRLDAELVVLSACETALGETVRGEGLMGLSRAFLAAGADRLVVSLWKVSDGGTAALMELFYRRIFADGFAAPEALRQAQLDLSQHPTYGAPYFWAGFIMLGDPGASSGALSANPE